MSQPKRSDKELAEAVDIGRAYLEYKSGFDKTEIKEAALVIADFFFTAHSKEWNVFDPNFPEILRAIAITLDQIRQQD